MGNSNLTIGALAARTECSVPTIRYYEEIGLLPQAARSANGRRHYDDTDQQRLLFIKRCRDFGFPIEQVRNLVSLFDNGDRACNDARDMAQDHLVAVRAKVKELQQLEESLMAFVQSCNAACIGGAAKDCTIIEDLSSVPSGQGSKSCCGGARPHSGVNAPDFVDLKCV